jgi:hypothetical protein
MTLARAGILACAPVAAIFAVFGTSTPDLRGQTPPSPVQTGATVHSIKLTLAPAAGRGGQAGCQLRAPSPQSTGVYSGDSVRLNVENGCDTEATISIGNFVARGSATLRLFKEQGPRSVTVPRGGRRHVVLEVVGPDGDQEQIFDYSVTLTDGEGKVTGYVAYCRKPPCPSEDAR